jgi:hypothetical protein
VRLGPSLGESVEIIRHAKVFACPLWRVGSRPDGKFIVVEKTPEVTQVRKTEGDSTICANHFQTAGLCDDPRNTAYVAGATSASREARLAELMQPTNGLINAVRAVEILRDRNLPGGAFAGNGHRSALNALIATHATVI